MSNEKGSHLPPADKIKTAVITGSTRGIGLGMANAFLEKGHRVVVSGRNKESVDTVVADLEQRFSADRVRGFPCNVTSCEQVHSLWDFALSCWQRVDVWINNAGIGQAWKAFWDLEEAGLEAVIQTNVQGLIWGAHVAMKGMLKQGYGWIFNMEGFGSRGRLNPRLAVYGTTKSAVRYFSRALVQAAETTPVHIGTLSPGMVVTDFLLDPLKHDASELAEAKKIFNILADRVDTVAPFLVQGILKAKKNGVYIAWLTRTKAMRRFLLAPFSKRDLFA